MTGLDVRQAWVGLRAGVSGAVLGFLLVPIAGCSDGGPYAGLIGRAEEVRELPFLEAVPSVTLTPEAFHVQVSQDVDERSDAELREYADTYGRLGFFDVNLDLRPILVRSRVGATAAFYSIVDKRITFVGDPEKETVIHEYVHALQDQHYGLTEYDAGASSSDGFLARRAIVEGEAVLATDRYVMEEQYGVGLDELDYDAYFPAWSELSERILDDSDDPLIFHAYRSFVYTYGLFFCAANLFGAAPLDRRPPPPPHDWSRQDKLFFTRAPATTAEILGPADAALAVGIAAVPAGLAADLERIGSDTLGAWYVHLLFRPVADGLRLARAWHGDRVLFARHTATGAAGVLWASAWDDEFTAMMAESGLHALHDGAGEPLVIERRGLRVVMARNFPAEIVQVLVDAAFAGSSANSPAGRVPLHIREAVRHGGHPTFHDASGRLRLTR